MLWVLRVVHVALTRVLGVFRDRSSVTQVDALAEYRTIMASETSQHVPCVNLSDKQHADFKQLFGFIDVAGSSCSSLARLQAAPSTGQEHLQQLWEEQRQSLQQVVPPGSRHPWHPQVLQLCMAAWQQQQGAYQGLYQSHSSDLPSPRTLERYATMVPSQPGLTNDHVAALKAAAWNELQPQDPHMEVGCSNAALRQVPCTGF